MKRSLVTEIGHRLQIVLLRLGLGMLSLSSIDTRVRFGGWLGRTGVRVLRSPKRRADRNFARIMPELDAAGRKALLLEMGDNFGRLFCEYTLLDRLSRIRGRTHLHGPGLDRLRAARAEGRPVILVSAHFANWEAIRIALLQDGAECGMIYRAFNNRAFDVLAREKMTHAGQPVLTKGREGMRNLVKHVRDGGMALILVDQKQTRAPLLPFLGHPAETVPVAAEFAERYGAELITAFATRQPDGLSFDVEIDLPVPEGEPLERMREINDRISDRIRAHPGQWLWVHNRWR